MRLNLTQHGAAYRRRMPGGSGGDSAKSGAWPLLARGVTCLVDSANGRDPRRRARARRDDRRAAGGGRAIAGP
jgi:hypothetical protein